MPSLKFSHIAITCADPLAMERFYAQYFGFARARVVNPGEDQVVFLKTGTVYLELFFQHEERHIKAPEGSGREYPGWRHIAFQVDDVDAKLAEIGANARVTLGPLSFDEVIPGWRTAWLADPEGNIVEISQGFVDQENPPRSKDQ